MSSKVYLAVPYAEKDQAKALGARWDPAVKKWYRLAEQEAALFARWQDVGAEVSRLPSLKQGPVTEPAAIDFVPYAGVLPPWD